MSTFIRRVAIRNYKSIASCQIDLGGLTFMVGPNGSGKSNFLDALRFVADSLRSSLDHALRDRGTIREVRRRSGGHPNNFAIRLDFQLPSSAYGHYAFRVGAKPAGGYEVQDEECFIRGENVLDAPSYFRVSKGNLVESTIKPMPAALPDRLFLVAASGVPEFRPVYDALSRIQVYNLNPKEISSMQKPDPGQILRRDGSNAASVFHQLNVDTQNIIRKNLARIVPGVDDAEVKSLGSLETVEFRQRVKGQSHPWRFLASAMSDGTLRAFGILVAVFQAASNVGDRKPPLLIGLEEPEIALHPYAAGVLLGALREGARHCQTIVTSHSPDLLDNPDIDANSLLAVSNDGGVTHIGRIDSAGRQMLIERLFTPGELLRQGQLTPEGALVLSRHSNIQLSLFDIRA